MKNFLLLTALSTTLLVRPGLSDEHAAVSIRRDSWGVAHIHGATHADAFFGMGYAQAEDYFWQLEDTCIRALGRYAEVLGEQGVRSDILNRSFEVASRSKADFEKLSPEQREMAAGFVDGINRFLQTHPQESPRLIDHFEPWYVLAMDRHMILDFTYRTAHISKPRNRRGDSVAERSRQQSWNAWDVPDDRPSSFQDEIRAAIGSNAWALAGEKTATGAAMLFINPHQPWYGMGQFYEAHIQSDEGLNFTGACFFGNPFPTIGHNEHVGWTYTVNEPDIADAWRVTFDDVDESLNYRYGDGYRKADEWQETLRIKKGDDVIEQHVTFRKTHHGPVVRSEGGGVFLAAQVGGLFDLARVDQAWGMAMSKNFDEWYAAISHCAIPMFNVVYADDQNNIFYAYNGSIPIRDPSFNWRKPVDGSNPATDWKGIHPFTDLPQVLNPKAGYVQSCNSAPFTTCHLKSDNPDRKDFPEYMVEDADVDMRRSKMSRLILKEAQMLTFEEFRELAYDTRLFWAMTEIPKLQADFDAVKMTNPDLADAVAEYFQHLTDWDFQSDIESTQTTLTVAWYEELYGFGYPAETLRGPYASDRKTWFRALGKAADKLKSLHGTWKKPWGEVHRLQRIANQPEVTKAGVLLNPLMRSLPCPGTPGPLGIIFTVYSSPEIPVLRPQRFAVVGASYLATVRFGDIVDAYSVMPFGASGRGTSPHFFDQAELYSTRQLKPAWFHRRDVLEHTVSQKTFAR